MRQGVKYRQSSMANRRFPTRALGVMDPRNASMHLPSDPAPTMRLQETNGSQTSKLLFESAG